MTQDIFTILKEEHEVIRTMIYEARTINDSASLLQQLEKIYQFVELHHHYLEEELLFKPASKNPWIKQGGPYCGYFFDIHMQSDPLGKACKLTHHKIPDQDLGAIPERLRYLFEENNPARIPIEEHLAGKMVLEHAIAQLKNEISKEEGKDITAEGLRSIRQLVAQYESIQDIHYKKEETCFFALCRDLFTDEDITRITEEFLKTSRNA